MLHLKRTAAVVVVAALLAAVAVPLSPAAGPTDTIKVGLVQGMFRDVPTPIVHAVSRPFKDLVQKNTGLGTEIDIAPDAMTLAARLKDKTYSVGVFHGFEYAWAKAKYPELQALAVSVPQGRKVQACVVVHKDATHKKLGDLSEEAVVVPRGAKAYCVLYLDHLRKALPANAAKPKTKPLVTAEEALDAVVTGDSCACLVDAAQLNGYQSLQPGASKNLKVLCESDVLPPAVIAYRKGELPDNTVSQLRGGLTTAHKTAAGKPLMMMWNVRGFEEPPADLEAQLERSLKTFPAPKPGE